MKTLNDLLTMSSVKGDLEDIQGFLRGIRVRKGIVEASIALKCVLHGLKTSFLWDTSLAPSPAVLLRLQAFSEKSEVSFTKDYCYSLSE